MGQAEAILLGRSGLKMSQEHLAAAAGISARTVVRAESGLRVSGESLRSICAVLGLDATRIAPVDGAHTVERDAAELPAPTGSHAEAAGEEKAAPVGALVPRIAEVPPKSLPLRLLGLRRTPLFILVALISLACSGLAFGVLLDRVAGVNDVRRWTLEIEPARVVATHLNAMAAGMSSAKPPAPFYFACRQDISGIRLFLSMLRDDDCGLVRHDILVETMNLPDGSVRTAVGPVGREFGRDVARRLSGDPKVRWSVAFASGRQAQGLAWFDPRTVPSQDMPMPPDSPSTWVYVGMSRNGAAR